MPNYGMHYFGGLLLLLVCALLIIIESVERLCGDHLHTMLFSSSRDTRKAALRQILIGRSSERETHPSDSEPAKVSSDTNVETGLVW